MLGVVLVVLTGGGASPLIGGHSPQPAPPFTFKVTKTVAVTTAADPDAATKKKAQAAAKSVTNATQEMLHTFYSDAYLAPDNWADGNWSDDVFSLFGNDARDEAIKQTQVLTAGSGAGAAFSSITPVNTKLRAKVLFDPKGVPNSAVDIVFFSAKGTNKDGSGSVALVSKGQYIFQKVGGEWKVVSFSVSRHDKAKKGSSATGGPARSSTPTAVSS